MKATNLTIGILAHVDAGKTTLSESILYTSGAIRSHGRVDHGDAFLDTDATERARGITIYSKLARLEWAGHKYTLLDTPGHADFSPEMERTLRVLDAAILVISAPDGVTAQVRTLWRLLTHYQVPTFVFVNKMDLAAGRSIDAITEDLRTELGEGFVSLALAGEDLPRYEEEVAVLEEALMERVLGGGHVTDEDVTRLVAARRLYPVLAGTALRDEGTEALLTALGRYLPLPDYPDAFGARVYKVTREDGQRLTWAKVTGGEIHVRDAILNGAGRGSDAALSDDGEDALDAADGAAGVSEKVAEIRYYNGVRFDRETVAQAGDIVALTGLSYTRAGDGLGSEETDHGELLQPILTSRVIALPRADGTRPDDHTLLAALRDLEEEEPLLHVTQDERTHDILVQIMGQVQIEILQGRLRERHGIEAQFGQSRIVYKETIRRPVEGVGHFEPLRHYAEVHVLLEPQAPGTGITFGNETPPNVLDRNWQNLIMTHLQERTFRGVLTGAALTDVRITLLGGKASIKHTVGGDFRQAAYRAVRQGLMSAENILLEPVLAVTIELPQEYLGRAMTDLHAMGGTTEAPVFEGDMAILTGRVPAEAYGDYARQVTGYTKGAGTARTTLAGYAPCHNAREVIDAAGYDPELDRWNPSYSVFCAHGAGTPITWDHVRARMHYDSEWTPATPAEDGLCHDGPLEDGRYLTDDYYTYAETPDEEIPEDLNQAVHNHNVKTPAPDADYESRSRAFAAEDKELQAIFESTYGTAYHQRDRALRNPENEIIRETSAPKGEGDPKYTARKKKQDLDEYLLVDGYNIIYAWNDLRTLATTDIKAARDRLNDILANYAGYARENVIVVYDAYKVHGGQGEVSNYHGIDVVYTKEAETADLYIEKTAHQLSPRRVTVATSDAIEQVIIMGTGAIRLSARGLLERILNAENEMREKYL